MLHRYIEGPFLTNRAERRSVSSLLRRGKGHVVSPQARRAHLLHRARVALAESDKRVREAS